MLASRANGGSIAAEVGKNLSGKSPG